MANTDAAFGLRPVRHLNGNPYNGAYNEYPIASGYSTDLLPGDPVKLVAAGTVQRAAAGDPILGVFMGCRYTSTSLAGIVAEETPYWPASTGAADAYAYVVVDPDMIFHIQVDDDSGAIAATDVGQNIDILVTAGSTTTRVSGVEADVSTLTGASAQLRVVRLANLPDNEWGDYANIEVTIVEHFLRSSSGI